MESVRLSNRTAIGLGDGQKIELGAFWNHKELYHPIFQVIDQVSDDFGLNARYTLESDAGHGLVMGVNWRTGEVDAKRYVNLVGKRGALTADALQKADTLEVYGEGRLAAGPFTFVAGGQYVHGNRSVDDFLNPATSDSRTYDAFNPKVGVLWQVTPEAQVYANVSKATELPTFSELVQFPVVGFVPLDPQRSWTVEVGTRGSAGPVEWDFSLYRAWVKGELLQFTTSASIPAATFNADETIHQGIEAGLAATLAEDMVAWGDRLTVRLSYTYSDFHFSGDPQYGDNRIPGQPPHVLTGEMEYRAAGGWSVTPNIEWVPKAGWVDFANSLKADSYAILGMRVSVPVGEKFALYVDGRNLLDKRYIASWSTITDAATVATNVFYPGDGIAVYAGAKARF
jgi:iron complex outermembrane receptor protein